MKIKYSELKDKFGEWANECGINPEISMDANFMMGLARIVGRTLGKIRETLNLDPSQNIDEVEISTEYLLEISGKAEDILNQEALAETYANSLNRQEKREYNTFCRILMEEEDPENRRKYLAKLSLLAPTNIPLQNMISDITNGRNSLKSMKGALEERNIKIDHSHQRKLRGFIELLRKEIQMRLQIDYATIEKD